jgi:aspartate carbamoyltransferase
MWDHFLSAEQIDRKRLCLLFDKVQTMRIHQPYLQGRVVACLFYEPSTRTARSFETAVKRTGGNVLMVSDLESTSVAKGESFADTIRTFNQYADLIVLRHPNHGAALEAANASDIPVINAGDGPNEHPTQALLDVYTMAKHHERLDGLTVTLAGDLKYGRTVHSLSLLLSKFDVEVNHVSPSSLRMPHQFPEGSSHHERLTPELLEKTDVLYMTRVQRERFGASEYDGTYKEGYYLTPELVDHLPESSCILHPFPRMGELPLSIDDDPRARYFDQMKNGVAVRAALMSLLLRRGPWRASGYSDFSTKDPWNLKA